MVEEDDKIPCFCFLKLGRGPCGHLFSSVYFIPQAPDHPPNDSIAHPLGSLILLL